MHFLTFFLKFHPPSEDCPEWMSHLFWSLKNPKFGTWPWMDGCHTARCHVATHWAKCCNSTVFPSSRQVAWWSIPGTTHLLCPHSLEIHSPGPSDWCPGNERSRSGPTLPVLVVCCLLLFVVVVVVVVVPQNNGEYMCPNSIHEHVGQKQHNSVDIQKSLTVPLDTLHTLCSCDLDTVLQKKTSQLPHKLYTPRLSPFSSWISNSWNPPLNQKNKHDYSITSNKNLLSNHPQKKTPKLPNVWKKTTKSPVCFVGFFTTEIIHRNPHLKSIRPTPCTPFHGTLQLIEGKSHQTGEPWCFVEVLCVLIKSRWRFLWCGVDGWFVASFFFKWIDGRGVGDSAFFWGEDFSDEDCVSIL